MVGPLLEREMILLVSLLLVMVVEVEEHSAHSSHSGEPLMGSSLSLSQRHIQSHSTTKPLVVFYKILPSSTLPTCVYSLQV